VKTTRQIEQEAKRLFDVCLVNKSLDAGRVRQVIWRLIESKRRDYLALLLAFQRRVRLDYEKHTAEVDSGVPLPLDLRSTIQSRLEILYGPHLIIHFANRPELVGGIRIKVGSDVYDGSVRSRLAALENKFSHDAPVGRQRSQSRMREHA